MDQLFQKGGALPPLLSTVLQVPVAGSETRLGQWVGTCY